MTEHLPECPAGYVADLCTTDIDPVLQEPTCDHCVGQGCICICNRLRACEQRVWKDPLLVVSRRAGWNDALISAREAVATMKFDSLQRDQGPVATQRQVLAAIDALKEKQ